jgi:hypothetical protein
LIYILSEDHNNSMLAVSKCWYSSSSFSTSRLLQSLFFDVSYTPTLRFGCLPQEELELRKNGDDYDYEIMMDARRGIGGPGGAGLPGDSNANAAAAAAFFKASRRHKPQHPCQ